MSKMPVAQSAVSFPINLELFRPVQEILQAPLNRKAFAFAEVNLKGRMRTEPREPVMLHVLRVATIVSDAFHGETYATALGLIHAVMEDDKTDLSKVERTMGRQMADDVALLTKPTDGTESMRQQLYLEGLVNASEDVKLVKLADYLDNICARRHTVEIKTTVESAKWFSTNLRSTEKSSYLERAMAFVDFIANEASDDDAPAIPFNRMKPTFLS